MNSNQQVQMGDISPDVRADIERLATQIPDWSGLSIQVKAKHGESHLRAAYEILKSQQKNNGLPINHQSLNIQTGVGAKLMKYTLNDHQKKVLIATACLLVFSLIYPPFLITANGITVSQGFHILWELGPYPYAGVVNIALLLSEVLVICLVSGIAFVVVSNNKDE